MAGSLYREVEPGVLECRLCGSCGQDYGHTPDCGERARRLLMEAWQELAVLREELGLPTQESTVAKVRRSRMIAQLRGDCG